MIKKTSYILEYVFIVLLGMLLALNYTLFVIENNFAPAGINGIAVMVQYKLNFSLGYMSLLINIPLCVFAYFVVRKDFAVKTLVFCLVYSFTYLFFQNMHGLEMYRYDAQGIDTVYPVIIAGLISGLCYGILFKFNACTGGTDIVAKFVSKKKPFLNFFWVTFVLNAVVAIISCFVYAEGESIAYKPACLCMLYCFVSSFVGNFMIKGSKSAYKFTIISEQTDEIENEIIKVLHHSATRISGDGIYSGDKKNVLICVVNKHQIVDFQNILKKFPKTFSFVEQIDETLGNFKKIK